MAGVGCGSCAWSVGTEVAEGEASLSPRSSWDGETGMLKLSSPAEADKGAS